jgi:YVTN family beta-propeller protein
MKFLVRNYSALCRLLFGAIAGLSAVVLASQACAAFGDLVAQYNFGASAFVINPAQTLMYATIPSQNCIAIIDANSLAVESTPFVGSAPINLAFSPDGSRAYVANSTSNFVAVFDTASRTVVDSFYVPEHPRDVVFGTLNRLWVLGQNRMFQIDATTGASTGPSITNSIYGGSLEISPDRNTLYYADYGVSPSTMYKYDVSGSSPVLVLQTPFGTVGSNGQDLALSHDGNSICYAVGSGQNNYDIAKFRTSDFASLGSFNTGPYPRAVTFAPDDSIVYAFADNSGIDVFSANTFLPLGTISGAATKLAVDPTGRYLFAGYADSYGPASTRVYHTGVPPAPTPAPTPTPTPTATPTPTPTPSLGALVADYGFAASSFAMSPTQALMYATIRSQNSIAIINTNTLAVEDTVFVGSGPLNLAFSPDGSTAFIANSTSNFVAVFDTASRTVVNSFYVSEQPRDVVVGTLNRLWVLGQNQIFQIDATTGASTGPSITNSIYGGSLEISTDKNTLYYADYGLSPSTMYKYDVSGSTPVLVSQTPFGTVGSNGEDLALSNDGGSICYAVGSGQNGYQIAKFRTSDFATLGSFNTGPYPQAVTFSPDASTVYASVHTQGGIMVFDAKTFLSLGTIAGPEVATKLALDSTGRFLFAGYDAYYGVAETRVYDTTVAPTPTPTPTPTCTVTPTVTLDVSDHSVAKGSDSVFVFSAPGNCRDTTVSYSMKGKARLGVDYTLSGTPGQVTIPQDQSSVTVTLHALPNNRKKAAPVKMIVQPGSGYFLGQPFKQTVSLLPH